MPYANTYHELHDLEKVMAYAVMAQDINSGYERNTMVDHYRKVDDYSVPVLKYSNRDIMLYSLGMKKMPADEHRIYMFESVPDELQTQRAKEIITYYTGLAFKALGSKINDFEKKILGFVKNGEVPTYDFGMIASMPKSYERAIERERVESEQRSLSSDSDFIGSTGDTITATITVLRKNFIAKLGCDVVNAKDDQNNLVVFFTSKGDEFESDKTYTIKARVKRHQMSNYHGGKENVLNYVKVVEEL